MKDKILNNIKREITKLTDLTDEKIRGLITSEIIKESENTFLDKKQKEEMFRTIYNDIKRLGKLEKLLCDDTVTEIMINGPGDVFIEKNRKIIRSNVKFKLNELMNLIQKIVTEVNRTVNQATPIVDARLNDGSRVNIILSPIALNGPIVTIRKFSKEVLSIKNLIENKTVNEEVAEFLEYLVKGRYNIFISGGTGSGKTTLLNILSNFIPKDERIITIEDSAELKITSVDNLVSLETRNKNLEGMGEISIRDLIRASLRMRPDRIIVGEVRGKETLDMLQAMNTGHDGSLSTGHANSARDILVRLESMILMNYDMPVEAIRRQIASALDIVIHVTKTKNGGRVISDILEIMSYEDGKYEINELYKLDSKGKLRKMNDLMLREKIQSFEELGMM